MNINFASVTLTLDQILGMYNNPVEILPAPGEGLVNIIQGFLLNVVGTTSYSDGGPIYLQYTSEPMNAGPFASITIGQDVLIGLAENSLKFVPGQFMYTVKSASSINKNVCITNDSTAFTGGEVNQSAIANVWYSIVPAQ